MRLGAVRLPKDLAAADDQALRRVRARLLQQISAGPGKPQVQPGKPPGTSTVKADGTGTSQMPLPEHSR